jgi:hypothetical protein
LPENVGFGSFASIFVCAQPFRLRGNLGNAVCPDFDRVHQRLEFADETVDSAQAFGRNDPEN